MYDNVTELIVVCQFKMEIILMYDHTLQWQILPFRTQGWRRSKDYNWLYNCLFRQIEVSYDVDLNIKFLVKTEFIMDIFDHCLYVTVYFRY